MLGAARVPRHPWQWKRTSSCRLSNESRKSRKSSLLFDLFGDVRTANLWQRRSQKLKRLKRCSQKSLRAKLRFARCPVFPVYCSWANLTGTVPNVSANALNALTGSKRIFGARTALVGVVPGDCSQPPGLPLLMEPCSQNLTLDRLTPVARLRHATPWGCKQVELAQLDIALINLKQVPHQLC